MSEVSNPLDSPSPQAWERLIEAVEPASLLLVIDQRLGASLRRFLAAEDILQEALLHAWRDRRNFTWQGVKSFRSWLLSIIDHRIGHAAGRQSAEKRRSPGLLVPLSGGGGATTTSGDGGYPAGSTTPSKVAMYREQAEAMRKALDALPEESRDIVRLRYFEERSLEEIAAQLGLGISAVRHRFRKGSETYVRRLRAALSARIPGGPPDSTAGWSLDPSPSPGTPH